MERRLGGFQAQRCEVETYDLVETFGRAQPGGPRADDEDVEVAALLASVVAVSRCVSPGAARYSHIGLGHDCRASTQ